MNAHIDSFMGIPVLFSPTPGLLARLVGLGPSQHIVVGPRWDHLTYEQQVAVLLHERHHGTRWHREIRYLLLPLCWAKWVQALARAQEFACDRFACENGFAAEMLEVIKLSSHIPVDEFYPTAWERSKRILDFMQRNHHATA